MRKYRSTVEKLDLQNIGQPIKVENDGVVYYGIIRSFMLGYQGYYIYIDKLEAGPLEAGHKITLLEI